MKKSEELFERLKKGISINEVPQLLEEVQREEALEKAAKENPFHFEDKKRQYFSDLWFSQRRTASIKQKDRVGLAYISKALGLGNEIAQKFAERDHQAYHIVGTKQSALPNLNLIPFWQEIKEIFPNTYTQEDIEFLAAEGILAVLHFKWQLEVPLAAESRILGSLEINAHAYK